MSLDSDGKLDGKTPVFNDLLAFIWNKMCRCPRDPLVKIAVDFFQLNDIQEARDLYHKVVPEKPGDKRRVRHRGGVDILCALYAELQALPSNSEHIFVATNLNNIPTVDLTSIDGATLVHKQSSMNQTLSELLTQHKEIVKELALIKGTLSANRGQSHENNVSTGPNNPRLPVEVNTVDISAQTRVHGNQTFASRAQAQSAATGQQQRRSSLYAARNANLRNSASVDGSIDVNTAQNSDPRTGANNCAIARRSLPVGHQSAPRSHTQTNPNESPHRQEHAEQDFQTWDSNRRRKRRQATLATGRKDGNELACNTESKEVCNFCKQAKSHHLTV